jgi:hypothetical protein
MNAMHNTVPPMAWLVGAVLIAAIVFGWLAGRKK